MVNNIQEIIDKKSEERISRFPLPKFDELSQDVQQMMIGAQQSFGFVPNVLIALAHRPEMAKAFMDFNASLERKTRGLSKAEVEMFILAFSNKNGCVYCVASHGAALRLETKNPFIADLVSVNYKEAGLSKREKAIINFAMKVSDDSASVNDEDFEKLKEYGLDEEDVLDIGAYTAFYNMSNRLMSLFNVKPDEEFLKLGR